MSPTYWNININEALEKINTQSVKIFGFADDCFVATAGPVPEELLSLAQLAVDKIVNWGRQKSLTFNPEKSEVMLFKRRDMSVHDLPNIIIDGMAVPYKDSATYLGIRVDKELSFKEHIDNKITKSKRLMHKVQSVVGFTWGPRPDVLRWAYQAVVLPTIMYGCVVWHHKVTQKQHINLAKLQRQALLTMAPTLPNTPTASLEKIHNVLQVGLTLQKRVASTWLRIQHSLTDT